MAEGDRVAAARGKRVDLRAAMGTLEQAIAAPATGREQQWRTAVGERLAQLSVALEQHLAVTEGDEGLFAEVMDQAPRLAHAIEGLRHDHTHIEDAVASLRKEVATGDAADVAFLRKQAVALMVELVEHRHRGADLVYSAYHVDIEAAD